jgi:hypothetical protein
LLTCLGIWANSPSNTNVDESGRSAPFRPGYPISAKVNRQYERLIPEGTSILPQVFLKVGSSSPSKTGQQSKTTDESAADQQREELAKQKQEIKDWENHMISLKQTFEMLRKRVKKIMKVTVIDNQLRPCKDCTIMQCLEGFDVKYLDWRKDDMCIDVILQAAPNVAEVTLYSSGNRTVLRGWAARNGLCNLRQVS